MGWLFEAKYHTVHVKIRAIYAECHAIHTENNAFSEESYAISVKNFNKIEIFSLDSYAFAIIIDNRNFARRVVL